eukprot:TRINITY_DN14153_c0_g1_i1.p1 TRINITY_DN14153_c0_g1~~TRINITY_DN14153_c0_g1_i1.p1  ORF type:complete len:420 (+),score=39.35 TRINITY_DN14153_c0_g1_i1:128-1387(+)
MINHHVEDITDYLTSCFVLLSGILLYASVLRSIHTILKQRKSKAIMISSIELDIDEWIYQQERKTISLGMPTLLGEELRFVLLAYCKNDKNDVLHFSQFFHDMPYQLQSSVMNWYYQDFYKKFWAFFEDLSIPFCEGVTQMMRPEIFPADWPVIKIGSAFKGIYFIIFGKIHLKNSAGNIFHTLVKGDYFGDTLMLDDKCNISFEVSQFSSLICLRVTGENFSSLYKRYSLDYRRIMRRSRFRREFLKGKLLKSQQNNEESSGKKLDMQRLFVMNLKSRKKIQRSREEIPLPAISASSFRKATMIIHSKGELVSKPEFDEKNVHYEAEEKEELDIHHHLDEKRKKYYEELHLDDSIDVPVSENPLWIHNFANLDEVEAYIQREEDELQGSFIKISARLVNFLDELNGLEHILEHYSVKS